MFKTKSLTFQILVLGRIHILLLYVLRFDDFDLPRLQAGIRDRKIRSRISMIWPTKARQKPEDVKYFASEEYKDRYAKESLNLLNPGEKLIIIPEQQRVVEQGPVEFATDKFDPASVLGKTKPTQWWEYFFGQTLSVKVRCRRTPNDETHPAEPVQRMMILRAGLNCRAETIV